MSACLKENLTSHAFDGILRFTGCTRNQVSTQVMKLFGRSCMIEFSVFIPSLILPLIKYGIIF